jgi:hypothetical protein
VLGEVEQGFARFLIDNKSADGYLHGQALAFVPAAIASLTVAPALRRIFRVIAEMQQRVAVIGCDQRDVAATPAIPTARTAAWDVLLSAERETTVTAIARFNRDSYFIDKHEKSRWPG